MEGRMTSDRSAAQVLTTLIGAVFILVGILGFIPGITSHLYGGLDFAGHNSQAKLFHVFQVSWLHNIVHIAFGLVGLAFARTTATARLYLIGGGVVYLDLAWRSSVCCRCWTRQVPRPTSGLHSPCSPRPSR